MKLTSEQIGEIREWQRKDPALGVILGLYHQHVPALLAHVAEQAAEIDLYKQSTERKLLEIGIQRSEIKRLRYELEYEREAVTQRIKEIERLRAELTRAKTGDGIIPLDQLLEASRKIIEYKNEKIGELQAELAALKGEK